MDRASRSVTRLGSLIGDSIEHLLIADFRVIAEPVAEKKGTADNYVVSRAF